MKKIFLTFFYPFFIHLYSQDFKYCYWINEKIDNTETTITFNSKDGVYRDLYCMNGEILDNYSIKINLTNEEKIKIIEYIESHHINSLEYCNDIPYAKLKSTFYFEIDENKITKKKCTDSKTAYRIRELQGVFLNIIRSKPEYKKVFYWEFIKK
ncbi:hypothetical protein CHRY9390_00985 [Chryseobacterium aquaeductus]|uniref:Uncharacterized protein n=1 Tax=Chryseobacterium aquaeductus TaxID=2675056 RepID=A0A9N8MMC3_9FLAO|nr:hypothetical protein [Chryseobacterium aquaeductus]CAA7330323.1 hypothetical protein CHRY9390_00985 [Chryseobacterium potabilaquae]CAD7802833.1 hypothetical protein CHRY9390_00985 [Chryseobacterium aquaeductus]